MSGPVTVVATPASAPLLANNPDVAKCIVFDKRGAEGGARGLWTMAKAVRSPSRDFVAYCVQGSWRTAMLAVLAGYQIRRGFDTSSARRLYTERVRYDASQHHSERVLRLALGSDAIIEPATLEPRLYPGGAEQRDVESLLASHGSRGDRLIALAPGSVWATKRWPYYADTARSLAAIGRVIVIGSDADRPLARAIVDATGGSAIDATGRLSLLASAELLSRCAVLVTNDSAPQHLASAMGTPTVTVFGPTVPEFGFGPLAPRSRTVGHPALPCRPCHPHGPVACPLGHWRCMRELGADAVLAEVSQVLAAA